MDGNGSLFGTLQGNTREVMTKFTVDLPKKHGRGGQSALRFARLRMEKRHNYVRKVAETAVECFIRSDKVVVAGIVLAGSADFKTELGQSDMFDQRLQVSKRVDKKHLHPTDGADFFGNRRARTIFFFNCLQSKIVKTVDVSYGGENGFNQAIELAADSLANVKFMQEKNLISSFFQEIAQDTGKYVFGVASTLQALETGAVETLICWENLDTMRFTLTKSNGEPQIVHLTPAQAKDKTNFIDKKVRCKLFFFWLYKIFNGMRVFFRRVQISKSNPLKRFSNG